jgi:hypothetical protein
MPLIIAHFWTRKLAWISGVKIYLNMRMYVPMCVCVCVCALCMYVPLVTEQKACSDIKCVDVCARAYVRMYVYAHFACMCL